MVIGYREVWPRTTKRHGQPTNFKAKILDGSKKHTMRSFSTSKQKKWNRVEFIHHAIKTRTALHENFRVQKNPQKVQIVKMGFGISGNLYIGVYDSRWGTYRNLTDEARLQLMLNDGFDSEEAFVDWFEFDIKRGLDTYLLLHFYDNLNY